MDKSASTKPVNDAPDSSRPTDFFMRIASYMRGTTAIPLAAFVVESSALIHTCTAPPSSPATAGIYGLGILAQAVFVWANRKIDTHMGALPPSQSFAEKAKRIGITLGQVVIPMAVYIGTMTAADHTLKADHPAPAKAVTTPSLAR